MCSSCLALGIAGTTCTATVLFTCCQLCQLHQATSFEHEQTNHLDPIWASWAIAKTPCKMHKAGKPKITSVKELKMQELTSENMRSLSSCQVPVRMRNTNVKVRKTAPAVPP